MGQVLFDLIVYKLPPILQLLTNALAWYLQSPPHGPSNLPY